MKILLYADNHYCETSSIVRKYGNTYSLRLENQIQSINWVEQKAKDLNCDYIICLGDFFDRPDLNDKELTALRDIAWKGIPEYFIVGNHESAINGLQFNTTKAIESANRKVISDPTSIMFGDTEICFLPYIIETDRKNILDYFGPKKGKRIILSHNDILGLDFGMVQSKTGFDIKDIETNSDLFVNGHLHNGQPITKKIINLGNLTGKDFGESAKYKHNIMILDTDTLQYEYIENPVAFNFDKIDINVEADLNKLRTIKNNAVLSIKCPESLVEKAKKILQDEADKIVESRLIVTKELATSADGDVTELAMDHIQKFIDCCKEKLENTVILDYELGEICK